MKGVNKKSNHKGVLTLKLCHLILIGDSLIAQLVKNLPAMQETWVRSLGQEDPLEKEMATHSRILASRIPMDRGAWWAAVYGVAQTWTRLKRLSSSPSALPVKNLPVMQEI